MFDLSGMTALVTGASGGLGSSIARALSAQGARLALSGSNVDKLNAFAGELGGDHVALPCNLSDGAAVDALVPQAVEALSKLDILVNNAGITRDNLAMRMKDEEFSVASKAGLIGMSKAMAQELASRGITVNCVAPGFMTSAMTDALNDQQREGILSKIPTGAMGSGDDIGAAVVYLASKEAGYVTGQTLHVNGGMAMP